VGSILGPGAIFLMLVGALVAVFKMDIWTSFFCNIVPLLIYLFVCLKKKKKIQVRYFYSSGIPWKASLMASSTSLH
jgi:chitin synthase